MAWKDDQQFATASADHVIHVHSGAQACTASLRGGMRDLTHLTWSPCGKPHTKVWRSDMLQVVAILASFCPSVSVVSCSDRCIQVPQQHLTLHMWQLFYPCEPRCSVIYCSNYTFLRRTQQSLAVYFSLTVVLMRFRQQVLPNGCTH